MSQPLVEYENEDETSQALLRSSSWPMFHRMIQKTIAQFVRFGMVGGLNTLIDLALFNVLLWLWPTHSTTLLLLYNSLAYALGGINSFVLNKYWTFNQRHAISRDEILRFVLTTLVGIACNDLILGIISNSMHSLLGNPTLWANASKIIAIFGTMCISYVGMRLWVFVKPAQATNKENER
ncbi:GtrA family protein [Ktedonobacteria bacterium brp13]|nr:GtrA family protein [Ktedonobacteria bacterium brp13]